jgi:hypothetical protein
MNEAKLRARAFLDAVAESGDITSAAAKAKISRRAHYRWMETWKGYPQAFQRARERFADAVRAEAKRRAIDGWTEPVFYQGEACGAVRKFSDAVLLRLMEANCPEFKRKTEITGADGGPVQTRIEVILVRGRADSENPE